MTAAPAIFNVYISYLATPSLYKIRFMLRGSHVRFYEENEGDWWGVHCFSYHESDRLFFEKLYEEFSPHVHDLNEALVEAEKLEEIA